MDIKQLIFDLCSAYGVSGSEESAFDVAGKYLSDIAEVTTDHNGNLYAVTGNLRGYKTILLDAHLDRIGLIVTDITDDGFAKVDKCGGIDVRVLQDTVLVTEDGTRGTVCCMPPHLINGSEDKATPIFKTWVDFAMPGDELKKHINIGDKLTFVSEPKELLGDKITSPALDNRCGAAALIYLADLLKDKACDYKVVILLSAQEETFGSGAVTGAYNTEADEAVIVDVSFANQPDISGQYASVELQKGAMIGISPVLNKAITNKLISLAKKKNIPYQLEPLSGSTGTNADHISVSKSGVKTALVSIPERYMHTQSEVISLSDVKATAELIYEYIMSGGAFDD